jgi:hypothetical protein
MLRHNRQVRHSKPAERAIVRARQRKEDQFVNRDEALGVGEVVKEKKFAGIKSTSPAASTRSRKISRSTGANFPSKPMLIAR